MRKLLFILFLLQALDTGAQAWEVKGLVRDSVTREPLAFVGIVVAGYPGAAGMTDIDGRFIIRIKDFPASLKFSHLGYHTESIVMEQPPPKEMTILLTPSLHLLREVEVKAGENPAHRIVRTTWQRRSRHDPQQLDAYRCKTYTKLVLTGKQDTAWAAVTAADKVKKRRADSLFDAQHLFMIESYSTRLFRNGKSKEIVTASRVSGSKEASVFMLALQYQPFSFYAPMIEVSGKNYLNPVSRNSEALYFFSLEDTLFSGKDTTYIISFKPHKNKLFDALEGILYISAPDYAIQNVIATPAGNEATFKVRIQQQYRRLDNGRWFPHQLNTDLKFLNVKVPAYNIVGESRIYVTEAEINPHIPNRAFDEVSLEVEARSSERPDTFWQKVRTDQLTRQEERTYDFLDSLSKAEHLELKLKAIESFVKGYIPIKFFDLDLSRIIAYNRHEGYRLGAGGLTNGRLSNFFAIGGYYAYGFRDRASKYKAEGRIYLYPRRDITLGLSYANDKWESGGTFFLNDRRPRLLESTRNLLVGRMDTEERTEAWLGFRWLKYIYSDAFARQAHVWPLYAYSFDGLAPGSPYTWIETGLSSTIAWNEQFYKSGNLKLSLGTKAPVIRIQLTRGEDVRYGGRLNYHRADVRIEKLFLWRRLGQTSFQVHGGVVEGKVPYSRLFTGRSNLLRKDNFRMASTNSFETMEMNEFLSDRYAALFFQHDFGAFFKIKKWSPTFMIIHNALIGSLSQGQQHPGITFSDARMGFLETGAQVNSLLTLSPGVYGIGAFYRYGAYASPDWQKNFAIKLTVNIVF